VSPSSVVSDTGDVRPAVGHAQRPSSSAGSTAASGVHTHWHTLHIADLQRACTGTKLSLRKGVMPQTSAPVSTQKPAPISISDPFARLLVVFTKLVALAVVVSSDSKRSFSAAWRSPNGCPLL